jgi:hypothetical protein
MMTTTVMMRDGKKWAEYKQSIRRGWSCVTVQCYERTHEQHETGFRLQLTTRRRTEAAFWDAAVAAAQHIPFFTVSEWKEEENSSSSGSVIAPAPGMSKSLMLIAFAASIVTDSLFLLLHKFYLCQ